MSVKVNENDYTCGTCKYCGCCDEQDALDFYDLNTCDDWTDPDEVELTDDEKAGIAGDKEAHRIMVEGREII